MTTDYSTNTGAGVYLGAYTVPLFGGRWTHVAIALVPEHGPVTYAELCGATTCWITQTDFRDKTIYGDGTASYQWTGIAGPDAIPAFEAAISDVAPNYDGDFYLPPESNSFVWDVLHAVGGVV